MPRLMADHNVEGHLKAMVEFLKSEDWRGHWEEADVTVVGLADEGLEHDSSDLVIWHTCQERRILLFTGNRNQQGPESLEEAIRTLNRLESVPVITLGDPNRFAADRSYAERAAVKLLEYLTDLDKLLGSGRLYVP